MPVYAETVQCPLHLQPLTVNDEQFAAVLDKRWFCRCRYVLLHLHCRSLSETMPSRKLNSAVIAS